LRSFVLVALCASTALGLDFFPLPAVSSNTTFWWILKWTDGTQSSCPPNASKPLHMATVAQNLHDGALGAELITIQNFKDEPCMYWGPNDDEILRWYTLGYQPSKVPIQLLNSQSVVRDVKFLAFAGDAGFVTDHDKDLVIERKERDEAWRVNGGYKDDLGSSFTGGYRYEMTRGEFPRYGIVPDQQLTANAIITQYDNLVPGRVDEIAKYCGYPATPSGWQQLRLNATDCVVRHVEKWALYMRAVTSFQFHGRAVQYVGYSETDDNTTVLGAGCEEWWYADGIGPFLIARYPHLDAYSCQSLLAGSSTNGLWERPYEYLELRRPQLVGWVELIDWCLDDGCPIRFEAAKG